MASWKKSFEILWHGDVPAGVEETVRSDILVELQDLARPSDLVFHTIWLTDDMDGPSVFVWGKKRDRRFHAEYTAETKYETLSGDAA